MSDSTEGSDSDVSSTYRSDEETRYTCILTNAITKTCHVKGSSIQGEDYCRFTDQDEKDIHGVNFTRINGELYVYPNLSRDLTQMNDLHLLNRIQSLDKDNGAVIIAYPSLLKSMNDGAESIPPIGLQLDIVIISPGLPTLVLSITSANQSHALLSYNAQLARAVTMAVRKTGMTGYSVVHGVLASSDFLTDEKFQSVVYSLKTKASETAIHNSLSMTTGRCQAVLMALVSTIQQDSDFRAKHTTKGHETERKFEYDKTVGSEDELKALTHQIATGFTIFPYAMQQFLESNHPDILARVISEMQGNQGWVYVDRSMVKTLAMTQGVPGNLLCDVILLTPVHPVRIITWVTTESGHDEVIDYNSRLAKAVKDLVRREIGSDVLVVHEVIHHWREKPNVPYNESKMASASPHIRHVRSNEAKYREVSQALLKIISESEERRRNDSGQRSLDHTEKPDVSMYTSSAIQKLFISGMISPKKQDGDISKLMDENEALNIQVAALREQLLKLSGPRVTLRVRQTSPVSEEHPFRYDLSSNLCLSSVEVQLEWPLYTTFCPLQDMADTTDGFN